MEHLFHPWHYAPLLAALPLLGALWAGGRAALPQWFRRAEREGE